MLKKINVNQLIVGMYLHEVCGSWMENPFWKSGFIITDPKEIQKILASSISDVWIDNAKGFDISSGESVADEPGSAQDEKPEALPQTKTVSVADELERAAQICAKSKRAVMAMFQEARMGAAVNTADAQKLVEDISDSINRSPNALISLARLKSADDYTYMHSVAVCALMVALSKCLHLDKAQTRSAGIAGLLHDLGKAVIPLEILGKPGKLTDEEFTVIKTHPKEGHQLLLSSSGVDDIALDVVLHHHEKTDGSGYPEGLKDSEITLYAKIGAICDVYDAITSNRPYKAGWDPSESLRKMAEWTHGHFDPKIFQAFVKSLGIYPIGSLVRLSSGRLGIVIEQSEHSLLQPSIKVFYSTYANVRIPPEIIDLSRKSCKEKIVGREDPAIWNFPDLNEIWSGLKGY